MMELRRVGIFSPLSVRNYVLVLKNILLRINACQYVHTKSTLERNVIFVTIHMRLCMCVCACVCDCDCT